MPFNTIFGWLIKKRIHQIELFRKYPIEVQEEWFERLIQQGKDTTFGKKYNFEKISSYEDFQSKVPLQDYNDVKSWVDLAVEGEPDVLWPGETKWFAKSSGTTSDRSKFIPVTKDSLEDCHYKGGKDLLAIYYSHFPNTKPDEGGNAVHHDITEDELSSRVFAWIKSEVELCIEETAVADARESVAACFEV